MKIAIIGAGYSGMVAAYDLKKAGHDITIFESAEY
ncbi:MAG TPA: FAD-dependent oxidoreductase, partial [Anaerolineales bacterium]|nr:FAD-dependent oxidoreductase [Anaerolineales bacterium]